MKMNLNFKILIYESEGGWGVSHNSFQFYIYKLKLD